MRYIIDRLEEDLAVCENEQKEMITIPRGTLPRELKEGDVVNELDGVFSLDEEETNNRRRKMRKKLLDLFG